MGKEVVVAEFKILFRYFPEGLGENQKPTTVSKKLLITEVKLWASKTIKIHSGDRMARTRPQFCPS